ncbi:MAG TPA: M4 family metallopeptidase [Telluria sp.]|nr:M4 family metallopeptidase [Telluria sp.]
MSPSHTVSSAVLAAAVAASAQAGQMMSGPRVQSPIPDAELIARLAAGRAALGLDPDHGYRVARHHPGVEGTSVVRLAHTYKGVPIFGSETVLEVNAAGAIVGSSVADRRAGLGKGSANLAAKDFSVRPRQSAAAAIAAVTRQLAAPHLSVTPPAAELVIYPQVRTRRRAEAADKPDAQLNAFDVEDVVAGYELAWLVRTRFVVNDRPLYRDTLVSAVDGRVLEQWNALQTAAPAAETGVGHSQYNGDVPLAAARDGRGYQLLDPTRGSGGAYGALAVTNANHTAKAGEIYTNASNTWGDGKQFLPGGSTTDANGQTAAVNAMWGMMNTYDMLRNTLGWHSLDGKDTATFIAAHVNTAYDNAYYDDSCKCMYIGDGNQFNSLGAIDVIGHEMSHGVTAATSNLLYFGESGGLNESNSDIGGEVVEAYARAGGTGASIPALGNDWVLGKEISKTGTPLRYMYKPSLDNASPDAWSSGLKKLDVHYSSGPNNRMFYFLAQGSNAAPDSDYYSKYLTRSPAAMSGIGLEKAYRIWFRAASTRFTFITNYADARRKVLATAEDMYGKGSREAIAVQRAYAAINVGPDVDE